MSNTRLKCAIITAGETVNTLAEKSGLHIQTIRRVINLNTAKVDTAIKIADVLNVKVEDIFGGQ